jgi:hypothetical protein
MQMPVHSVAVMYLSKVKQKDATAQIHIDVTSEWGISNPSLNSPQDGNLKVSDVSAIVGSGNETDVEENRDDEADEMYFRFAIQSFLIT